MAIIFPSNPTLNQTYTNRGVTWQFNGNSWAKVSTTLTSIASNVVPAHNEIYDLGHSTLRWRDLYLSGNSINLGGAVISASNNSVILPAGSRVGNVTIGSGGASVVVSANPPSTPVDGTLWIDSETGDFNAYFSNGWATLNSGGSGAGGVSSLDPYTGNIKATGSITANVPFFLGNTTITANFTVPTGFNAMTPGPVTVANDITITVPDGSTWTVV
jgi:hypothetical protein